MLYSILFLLTFTFGPAQQQFDQIPCYEESRPTKEAVGAEAPFMEDTLPRPIPPNGYVFR